MNEFDDFLMEIDDASIRQLEMQLSQIENQRPPVQADNLVDMQNQIKALSDEKIQIEMEKLAKDGEVTIVRRQLTKVLPHAAILLCFSWKRKIRC